MIKLYFKNYIIARDFATTNLKCFLCTKKTNLSAEMGTKTIILEINKNCEINITKVAKLFGKKWSDWKKRNSKIIETYEILEGRTLIREIGSKNKKQTFLSLILALRVLNDYDPLSSYHIFKAYEQSLLDEPNKKIIELENYLKQKFKNKPLDVALEGGKFLLYAYACNNGVKFGISFSNKTGQRLKSHQTSVPNLAIDFVIYSSKETLQKLQKAIKEKFKIKNRKEHINNCKIGEFKEFVLDYLKLMGYTYKEESIDKLTKLNIFLAS